MKYTQFETSMASKHVITISKWLKISYRETSIIAYKSPKNIVWLNYLYYWYSNCHRHANNQNMFITLQPVVTPCFIRLMKPIGNSNGIPFYENSPQCRGYVVDYCLVWHLLRYQEVQRRLFLIYQHILDSFCNSVEKWIFHNLSIFRKQVLIISLQKDS